MIEIVMGMFTRTYFTENGIYNLSEDCGSQFRAPHNSYCPCGQVLAAIASACRWSAGDLGLPVWTAVQSWNYTELWWGCCPLKNGTQPTCMGINGIICFELNHNQFVLNSTVYVMGVFMSPKTCTLWENVMICAQPFWPSFFGFLCL